MKRKLLIFCLFVGFIWVFLYSNNHWLQTTKHTIFSERIPKAFDGMKIVHLSDLHDATFGEKQSHLVNKIKKINPDVVFITGDLIDSNRYDLQNSLDLVEQLTKLTKVFYVTGNHEVAINEVDEITNALSALGVFVLMNESVEIEQNGEKLIIAGVEDPLSINYSPPDQVIADSLDQTLADIPEDLYILLLSHRPEVFDVYTEKEINIVFTGHAHGGQFRIPGLGGLIAPGQGWFPKYTSGKHEKGDTTMVVSRGLGNSIMPFRIFNRPEIVVVNLKAIGEK